ECARLAVLSCIPARVADESTELRFRHFSRGHRELAMLDAAFAADVTCDRHVVRHINRRERNALVAKQPFVTPEVQGVSAQHEMIPSNPEIARPSDSGSGWRELID